MEHILLTFPSALDVLSFSWHLYVRRLHHALIWSSFLHFLTRYYNCVPFAGCVFVGPSKICQPRVKTFEELPLEMHPQKAPQVSSLSSHQSLKMWTGWWHFANAIRLWEFSPQVIAKNSRCCQRQTWQRGPPQAFNSHDVQLCLSPGQPDGQRDGSGLRRIWENWTQAPGCCLKKVNHTKATIHITVWNWRWYRHRDTQTVI